MKLQIKIFLLLIFTIITAATWSFWTKSIQAEDCSEKSLSDKVTCYQNEVNRLGSQSKTLSNQIAQYNAQISLTSLKIQGTEEKIALLGGRINQLEGSLTALSEAFSSRVVETYKMAKIADPILTLLSARDLKDAVTKFHYLQQIQIADEELLKKLQTTQTNYKLEKTGQEELQAELNKQKINLDQQKKAKNTLLAQTKNDEVKYQQLLSQALAERAAIEKAIVSGVKVGPVKRGDAIGLVGNSGYPGCSTGKHLHFEVRKDNNWVDPVGYLSSKTVVNEQDGSGNTTVGNGSWPWPIKDTIRLTQFYGHTPFSWQYKYSGGIHTGYDMVSTSGDIIYTPADGTLYKSAQLCGASTINIIYIEHADNVVSFYLHVQ